MNIISHRVNHLSESETLAMTRMSRELKAKGHDVINLSIGQPDFYTPEYIKQAAKRAIDENYSFYSPVSGFKELIEAIQLKFKRDNNLDFRADQIVVSAGAKHSIANTILSLVNPGEEVIIPTPYWLTYREVIKLVDGVPVYVKGTLENDFKITPEQVEAAITEKSKVFIFSSPCNPTGSVYTKEELEAIAKVIAKHDHLFVISDEIYEHIIFSGKHQSIAQFDFIKDQVIVINGLSKGFAMTGWRLGYIGAPVIIAKACHKLQGQVTSGVCSIAQQAAIKALQTDPAQSQDLKKMVLAFRERRDLVIELLKDIPELITNVPQGAFYVFPDAKSLYGKTDGTTVINNSEDLCNYILQKVFVALVPGSAFGDPNCIRISYAASTASLKDALHRIKNAISDLY